MQVFFILVYLYCQWYSFIADIYTYLLFYDEMYTLIDRCSTIINNNNAWKMIQNVRFFYF